MTEDEIEIGKCYYARTSNIDTYVTMVKVTGKGVQGINQGKKRKELPAWVVQDLDRGRSIRIGTIRKFLSRVEES